MSPLSLTNLESNMARQILLLFVLSLMVYITPAQANDHPDKDGAIKSEQPVQTSPLSVRAPFSQLAPATGGNPFPHTTAEQFSAPTFGDIDDDGDFDMFSGNIDGNILFFENTGSNTTPTFVAQTGVNNPMDGFDAGDKSSATLVDIDNDDDLDMFVGEELGEFDFYENTGTNLAPTFVLNNGSNPLTGVDVGNRSQVYFVDLDNDGDYDAVTGGFNGVISYFENTGNATTPAFTEQFGVANPFSAFTAGGSEVSRVALGDIDLDLDYDLVLGSKTNGDFRYFENQGSVTTPTFVEQTGANNPFDTFSVGGNKESSPAFVNLDGGNGIDMVAGNTDGDFYYYVNADPLPVELTSFNVVRNHGKITLTWTTASETNNAGFEIQRRGARGFEAVSWVEGAGTTTETRSYAFTIDRVQPGRQSFRLKQVDFDGAFVVSKEASINVELESSFFMSKTSPEPFNPQTTFNLTVAASQQVTIGVYDMNGRMVELLHSGELQADQPYQFYVTGSNWASGRYIIRAVGEAFQGTQMITLLK